ncbi:hypothetical protein KEM48_006349 [Puccinia striiformis f. sp. tritici PST-130]|nr:hypothetical protein KEM48_006349 [Puccinia striiformis f. sp. tritici PST-130]
MEEQEHLPASLNYDDFSGVLGKLIDTQKPSTIVSSYLNGRVPQSLPVRTLHRLERAMNEDHERISQLEEEKRRLHLSNIELENELNAIDFADKRKAGEEILEKMAFYEKDRCISLNDQNGTQNTIDKAKLPAGSCLSLFKDHVDSMLAIAHVIGEKMIIYENLQSDSNNKDEEISSQEQEISGKWELIKEQIQILQNDVRLTSETNGYERMGLDEDTHLGDGVPSSSRGAMIKITKGWGEAVEAIDAISPLSPNFLQRASEFDPRRVLSGGPIARDEEETSNRHPLNPSILTITQGLKKSLEESNIENQKLASEWRFRSAFELSGSALLMFWAGLGLSLAADPPIGSELGRLPLTLADAGSFTAVSVRLFKMNNEKLKQLQAQTKVGTKGQPRRKEIKRPKGFTANGGPAGDDKKLQAALKKLNVQPMIGMEEVNMFKDEGSKILHFSNPKVHGAANVNTFAIHGNGVEKDLTELVPGILPQLGAESIANLRRLASSLGDLHQANSMSYKPPNMAVGANNDDDDVPALVDSFDVDEGAAPAETTAFESVD